MKTLIIGGAGFIGSNLCKALKEKDHELISIDNYFTGKKDNHIDGVQYIDSYSKDINNLGLEKIDLIYHLGEYSRVEESIREFDKVWQMNFNPMSHILNFAKTQNAKLIYAASSTRFYNDNNGEKLTPYTFSKYFNLELIKNYSDWYGLKYAITYFYNVYGPNEISEGKYSTLIAKFTSQFKKRIPLTVVKPGTQRRHFTHVKDIVSGLVLVGEIGNGDGYAIGGDDYFSIDEVAKKFTNKIEYIPERKGNRMDSTLNIQKIKELGWVQKEKLDDYITQIKKSIG